MKRTSPLRSAFRNILGALIALAAGTLPAQEYQADAWIGPEAYRSLEERVAQAEAELAQLRARESEEIVTAGALEASASGAALTAVPAEAPKPPAFPTVKLSGVFQVDSVYFQQDANSQNTFGRIQDGTDFRRARLAAGGSVAETMNYFLQMDFAFFGRPTFTDLWIESTKMPTLGTVRVGQWKQPFSLEVVSSFRYTTFMERSLVFQPFTPFRHPGIGFYNNAENLRSTWAASYFRSGQDQFGGSISTDGGHGTAERVTWLPFYDEPSNGRYYLHLGLGHFFNAPPRDLAAFRSIPEIFVGEFAAAPGGATGSSGQALPIVFNGTPFFVNTGAVGVNSFNVIGTELLWVNGPLSLQSEMMVNFVNLPGGNTAVFPGGYAQLGYFLTGEHRPYNRVQGAIDRILPFEDFFRVDTAEGRSTGRGAWEVAGRVSFIDLNDAGVTGGRLTDLTLGVNWYMNAYSKLVFNYINASLDHPVTGHSDTNVFAARAQVDF